MGGGATAHRHHRNPAEAWRRWRGEEGANQAQASVSTCTLRSSEKSSAKSRALLPAWDQARQSQRTPRRRSCSTQDQGSARASAVMVRPAGAVPSRRPETIRGERNASGTSSRMCLRLEPVRRAARAVGRVLPLRHDALEAPLSVGKHGRTVALHVLVEPNAGASHWPRRRQASSLGPATPKNQGRPKGRWTPARPFPFPPDPQAEGAARACLCFMAGLGRLEPGH